MAEPIISVSGLTKDYGAGRGIFDISFDVMPGEVFGYLGTNGSGKTTTIRHMMGFIRPQKGTVLVHGMDPWTRAPELMQHVSYIPGEIAFPSFATGTDFLKVQAQYMEVSDTTRMKHITELMNLDVSANLKRMSKGMKQKTAIVAALMADMEILILDEPTTGLDPLMRENFLDLIREEKEMGHTVFMSSHIFEEIEDVCDKVGIIQDGKLMEVLDLSEFRHTSVRKMKVGFSDEKIAHSFCEKWNGASVTGKDVSCDVLPHEMNKFFHILKDFSVASLREEHIGLEEYFMKKYGMKKSA